METRMSKSTPAPPAAARPRACRSTFTGPLHVQIGDERITILPGGPVLLTPALAAALGDLVDGLVPDPGPAETTVDGPTEEA
jgi:hypothetical protein